MVVAKMTVTPRISASRDAIRVPNLGQPGRDSRSPATHCWLKAADHKSVKLRDRRKALVGSETCLTRYLKTGFGEIDVGCCCYLWIG